MSFLPEQDDGNIRHAPHHNVPLQEVRPSPVQTDFALNMAKRPDSRGAAKGLTLDNMEDMAVGLRQASEPTRIAKKIRHTALVQKARANRKKKAAEK